MSRSARRSGQSTARHVTVLALAALLFAAILALRVAIDDSTQPVSLLYVLPVALVAVELGRNWGLGAALLALGLFALWDVMFSDVEHAALDYVSRAVPFVLLGGVVGELVDRMRSISVESARFWELSPELLAVADFEGRFLRVNPAWKRTLGWTREELCASPFVDFVHPDDREATAAEAAALEHDPNSSAQFENRYRCKDGSYRWLQWSSTSVPEEGRIYAFARDVSARRRAEEELRGSERFLDSVLENLPILVWVLDARDRRWVRVNRAVEDLLGRRREELVGRRPEDVTADAVTLALDGDDGSARGGGGVRVFESTLETPTNGARIIHTRALPIPDEHGEPRLLLGISEDITERRSSEDTVEAARAEAERANQAKSEFLSRMSHELRTPLNAVIGFGQLLELDELTERQREGVKQILSGGRHLLDLINEVLDISRIESGTMSMSLEPVHVGSVLAESLSLVRPLAEQSRVRMLADPSALGDLHALADQQRLKQVLLNLLSNAIKYNRPGGEVSVRLRELEGGRAELVIADTGAGMTTAQLARLFDPFDRLGAERTTVEGTGLGLPLAKRLMEAMGGTIEAASEPGVGTAMRIELGLAPAPRDRLPAEERPERTGSTHARHTILYVEDNLSNLKLVERLLDRLPHIRLVPAMHGALGLELARQHAPGLILLDLHLPDLGGEELLELLKRDPATAQIPVVILSADASAGQVERLRSAGATDYLTKPIDILRLYEAITRAIPGATS